VEVLPFHQMGRDKWKALGIPYPLEQTKPPTPELVAHVQETFRSRGLVTY
jgi:pyruvate formate lyase activating enzyme